MEKGAIKNLIYGGVNELMADRKYFYHSSVGKDYCHFTEEGKVALMEYMLEMAKYMREAEQADLDKRSVDIMMKELGK